METLGNPYWQQLLQAENTTFKGTQWLKHFTDIDYTDYDVNYKLIENYIV